RVERVVQLSSPGTSLAPTKSKISTETAAGLVPLLVTKHATFSTLSTTGVLSVMACAIVPETMSGRVSKLRRRIIWSLLGRAPVVGRFGLWPPQAASTGRRSNSAERRSTPPRHGHARDAIG